MVRRSNIFKKATVFDDDWVLSVRDIVYFFLEKWRYFIGSTSLTGAWFGQRKHLVGSDGHVQMSN